MDPKTSPDQSAEQPLETFEPKRPSSNEIIINSEDGTISTPNAIKEDSNTPSTGDGDSSVATEAVESAMSTQENSPEPNDTEQAPESSMSEPTPTTNEPLESAQLETKPDNVPLEATNQPNPLAIPPKPVSKSGSPKVAIVVAIVVALGLMAVSVMAYMKIQSDKQQPADLNNSHQRDHTTEETSVTDSDVKTVSDDIDTELKKIETETDLPAEDTVTNEALGL